MTNIGTHVITCQIKEIRQHPNADKLNVCSVTDGTELLQVITSATNIKIEDKVPVAIHGARLHGEIKIKKGKLRGEISHGMFCGKNELGLGESTGIVILPETAELGKPLPAGFQVPDITDQQLTPDM